MLSNAFAIRLHPLNLVCCIEVYGGRIKKSKFLTVFYVFCIKTLGIFSFSNIWQYNKIYIYVNKNRFVLAAEPATVACVVVVCVYVCTYVLICKFVLFTNILVWRRISVI